MPITETEIHTPTLTLRAFNPPTELQFAEIIENEATTQLIQFNINKPPAAGTIFVDLNNNGIVRATISDGYKILTGNWQYQATGVFTDGLGAGESTQMITRQIIVDASKLSDQEFEFSVRTAGNMLAGNVTICFKLFYARTEPK